MNFPDKLREQATLIDERFGPISGQQADKLADLLREAAASISWARAESCQKGAESIAQYESLRDPTEQVRIRGVGRVDDEPRALLLLLTERPTDDEIRSVHEFLRDWRLNGGTLKAAYRQAATIAGLFTYGSEEESERAAEIARAIYACANAP